MPPTTAFPTIDVSGVPERPLAEILRHDPDTPEFNQILRVKDRSVSITKLKRTKWPVVTTVEPGAPEAGDPTTAPDPVPETAPE